MRPPGKWNVASAGVSSLIRSGIALPADFDATEQDMPSNAPFSSGAQGGMCTTLAENLFIRLEAHFGAAPVHGLSRAFRVWFGQFVRAKTPCGRAADRAPPATSSNLRQRIDDRDADAVQAARRLVGLAVELAARMQRRHDDFERRFLRNLGCASTEYRGRCR